MKVAMRKRYYCDHCKKSGGSRVHMEKHEAGCTLNPNRKCGFCEHGETVTQPMPDLIAALGNGDAEGMAKLRELAGNCPGCILAALRQSQALTPWTLNPQGTYFEFDFKKESAAFWKEVNSRREEELHAMVGAYQ